MAEGGGRKRSSSEHNVGAVFALFLKSHTCYDIMPTNTKMAIFDTELNVAAAFYALVNNELRAAPLWDKQQHKFVGMLTITDFINILQKDYYSSPEQKTMEELEEHKISTWRHELREYDRPLVSIKPTDSLLKAAQLLLLNKVHRLPIIDTELGHVFYIITHKRLLRFLYLFAIGPHLKDNVRIPLPPFMYETIADLHVGTYHDLVTCTETTTLIEALNIFIAHRVSALPIVDAENKLVNIYSKFDVLNLVTNKTYCNLDVAVKSALKDQRRWFESVETCTASNTLADVVEKVVRLGFHRLVIVDKEKHVEGIISLSDILAFIIIKPLTDLQMAETVQEAKPETSSTIMSELLSSAIESEEPSTTESEGSSVIKSQGLASKPGPSKTKSEGLGQSASKPEGPSVLKAEGPSVGKSEGPSVGKSEGPPKSNSFWQSKPKAEEPSVSKTEGPPKFKAEGPPKFKAEGPSKSKPEGILKYISEEPTVTKTEGPSKSKTEGLSSATHSEGQSALKSEGQSVLKAEGPSEGPPKSKSFWQSKPKSEEPSMSKTKEPLKSKSEGPTVTKTEALGQSTSKSEEPMMLKSEDLSSATKSQAPSVGKSEGPPVVKSEGQPKSKSIWQSKPKSEEPSVSKTKGLPMPKTEGPLKSETAEPSVVKLKPEGPSTSKSEGLSSATKSEEPTVVKSEGPPKSKSFWQSKAKSEDPSVSKSGLSASNDIPSDLDVSRMFRRQAASRVRLQTIDHATDDASHPIDPVMIIRLYTPNTTAPEDLKELGSMFFHEEAQLPMELTAKSKSELRLRSQPWNSAPLMRLLSLRAQRGYHNRRARRDAKSRVKEGDDIILGLGCVGGGEGRGGGGGDYRAPRDLGTRETLREKARISEEREVGGGGGGGRTYSRRDSDRNMRESDYGLDNRTGNSRYRNTNYRGNHPRRDEQEPEWYSSGPVSQSDTIELHGFEPSSSSTEEKGGWDEEQERDERDSRNYKERQPPSYVFKNSKQEAQQRDQQQQQQQQEEEAYYDEREEPSHCSSPPLNQQQPPQTTQPQQQGNFDLEQYFRSDGGSGVADHIQALLSATEPVSAGGSRFMQFFNNMDGGGAAEPMSWAAVAAAPAGQRSVPAQAQADLAPKNASAPQDAKPRGPRAPRGERTGREAGRNPPVEGQEQQQQQQQQPRQAQQKYADAQQLFVANIAQNIEEQELWAFFEREFGRVLKVRIKRKNVGARDNAQAVPNFGFVVFESPDSVALALTRRPLIFHNATGDHRLNIEEKKQRSERPNSGNRIGGRQNGNMGGRGGMGPRGNGRGGPARGSNRGGGYAARR